MLNILDRFLPCRTEIKIKNKAFDTIAYRYEGNNIFSYLYLDAVGTLKLIVINDYNELEPYKLFDLNVNKSKT